MKAKHFIVIIVIVIVLLVWFKGCYNVNITPKPTTKGLLANILEGLGILNAKMDNLSADVDTIKVDVSELKSQSRKCPTKTIWRTRTLTIPQATQPVDDQITIPAVTPQPRRTQPQVGTITPGDTPGPKDLLFCIDLEPTKSDSSKKFLFWELVNNLGYQISSVIPNNTGKSANMRLAPGSSVDGIFYDGEMLKMSVSSLGNWYAQIMGTPMPSDFRPAIRSNKSGWSSKIMIRSGDYFVYRF